MPPSSQGQRRFLALAGLLIFLCSASGVRTELCALAAALDRSHHCIAGFRGDGAVLVLAHWKWPSAALGRPTHQHGLIASALCILARPTSSQTDHRLIFAAPNAIEKSARFCTIGSERMVAAA